MLIFFEPQKYRFSGAIVSCTVRLLVPYLFVAITLSCGAGLAQYEYADGNGNLYVITRGNLSYVPVKPEESSSGTYSGGNPKTVSLTSEQFELIREALEKGIKSNNLIRDRVKMSGAISIVNGKDKTQYILAPGSAEIQHIESLLKEIIRN